MVNSFQGEDFEKVVLEGYEEMPITSYMGEIKLPGSARNKLVIKE